MNLFKKGTLLTAILALSLASCGGGSTTSSTTATASDASGATSSVVSEAAGTESTAGATTGAAGSYDGTNFSFEYPSDLTLTDSSGMLVISPASNDYAISLTTVPSAGAGLTEATISTIFDSYSSAYDGITEEKAPAKISLGGEDAYQATYSVDDATEGKATLTMVIGSVKGDMVVMAVAAPDASSADATKALDQIIDTFKVK